MGDLFQQILSNDVPENYVEECIVYLKTDEAVVIKTLSEFLNNNLGITGTFNFTKKGIFLKGIDSDEKEMIDVALHEKNFDKYHCDRPYSRGVPLDTFHSMFKNLKKKDRVILYITKADPTKIRTRIYNDDKDRDSRSFTPTCDPIPVDCARIKGYKKPISIPGTEFQRMCKDIQSYKTIDVICYPGGLIFQTRQGQMAGTDKTFTYGDKKPTKEDDENNLIYVYTFDCKLICQMAKLYGFSKRIHIYTLKDVPMKINATIGTLGEMNIILKDERNA